MSSSTSSAEWPKLYRYSDRALQIDRELAAEASRIAGILRNFEATCIEYRVSVSHLAGEIQGYASRAEGTDMWVRQVGVDFQRADQVGSAVFGGETSREFLNDIIIAERVARIGFAKGLRFRPYAGWGAFFRDSILKLGYRGKWTVIGTRSALRAAGIAKNVRWFSYKYLTKVFAIKSGSWTVAARAAWNRLLREPGSIFRKLPRAANAFVRKLPRNSPFLPAATFKQRIAEAFGKGASIGGKLKSAAGIGLLITVATNIYEFHWGTNRHLGLRSRQFVTSTVADGSATLGIIAVSTAVGSLIPVPVVGTVAGFLVGVGLAYAYEKWGKDAWRNAVDGAGKRLQDALTPARRSEQIQSYKEQRDRAREAADIAHPSQDKPVSNTPAEPGASLSPSAQSQSPQPAELTQTLHLVDGREVPATNLDGKIPVEGLDSTYGKPGQLPFPSTPMTSSPKNRHPSLYSAVINQFGVEGNPRYEQDNFTYCNTFAGDVGRAMGVPLPTKQEYSGNIDQATIGFPQLNDWFTTKSHDRGWREIDPSTPEGLSALQKHVNDGRPAMAVDPGHIAVVRSGQQAQAIGDLQIAQAGGANLNNVRLGDAGLNTRFKPRFFIHD